MSDYQESFYYPKKEYQKHPNSTKILNYAVELMGSSEAIAIILGVAPKVVIGWIKNGDQLLRKEIMPLLQYLYPRRSGNRFLYNIVKIDPVFLLITFEDYYQQKHGQQGFFKGWSCQLNELSVDFMRQLIQVEEHYKKINRKLITIREKVGRFYTHCIDRKVNIIAKSKKDSDYKYYSSELQMITHEMTQQGISIDYTSIVQGRASLDQQRQRLLKDLYDQLIKQYLKREEQLNELCKNAGYDRIKALVDGFQGVYEIVQLIDDCYIIGDLYSFLESKRFKPVKERIEGDLLTRSIIDCATEGKLGFTGEGIYRFTTRKPEVTYNLFVAYNQGHIILREDDYLWKKQFSPDQLLQHFGSAIKRESRWKGYLRIYGKIYI